MRIRKALSGAAVVAVLGMAGTANAFELNSLSADTPPNEALRYGLNSYKSGDTKAAVEALNFAAWMRSRSPPSPP